ncbi:hypothetical protein MMC27_000534 [Xylographa pallens]|nr:hypothetical protein [Xylographa pallens]
MRRDGAAAADGYSGIEEADAALGKSLQSSHVHWPSLPQSFTTQQSLAHRELRPIMGIVERPHHAGEQLLNDGDKVRACASTGWKANVQRLRQLLDSQEAELEGTVGRTFRGIMAEKRALLREYLKGKETQVKKWRVKEAQILILQAMLSTARVGGEDA